MNILSVIVPVYNAEKVLGRCVDSLLRQGLSTSQYEVLLINDGSRDRSLDVCRDYARRYKHIRVIDQPNQGVAVARNRGIAEAKGDWIAFIDADDYLLDDGYALAYLPYADHSQAEVIQILSTYDFLPAKPISQDLIFEGHVFDMMKTLHVGLPSFCWLYIYRRDFLLRNHLEFEKLVVGEDQLFTSTAFLLNPFIIITSSNIYRYVIMPNSATTKREKQYIRRAVVDYLYAYEQIVTFAKQHIDDETVWSLCVQSINSKKAFGVTRMLSSEYTYHEFLENRKLVHRVAYYPVVSTSHSIRTRFASFVMNKAMNNFIVYKICSCMFKHLFPIYQKRVMHTR